MKKLILKAGLLTVLTFSLVACGGSSEASTDTAVAGEEVAENEAPASEGGIEGVWTPVKATVNDEVLPFFGEKDECGDTTVTFNSDQTVVFKGYNSTTTENGTDCQEVENKATYTVEGNNLTLMAGEMKINSTYKIEGENLILETKQDMDGDGKDDTRVEIYKRFK